VYVIRITVLRASYVHRIKLPHLVAYLQRQPDMVLGNAQVKSLAYRQEPVRIWRGYVCRCHAVIQEPIAISCPPGVAAMPPRRKVTYGTGRNFPELSLFELLASAFSRRGLPRYGITIFLMVPCLSFGAVQAPVIRGGLGMPGAASGDRHGWGMMARIPPSHCQPFHEPH